MEGKDRLRPAGKVFVSKDLGGVQLVGLGIVAGIDVVMHDALRQRSVILSRLRIASQARTEQEQSQDPRFHGTVILLAVISETDSAIQAIHSHLSKPTAQRKP